MSKRKVGRPRLREIDINKILNSPKQDVFEVETILDKRKVDDNVVQYFIKWKGYDEIFNTWEPIENLNCAELVQEFEQKLKNDNKVKPIKKDHPKMKSEEVQEIFLSDFTNKVCNEGMVQRLREQGIDVYDEDHVNRGLEFDKISDGLMINGELHFRVHFKDTEGFVEVPSKELRITYPQLIIDFYERRLEFCEF